LRLSHPLLPRQIRHSCFVIAGVLKHLWFGAYLNHDFGSPNQ